MRSLRAINGKNHWRNPYQAKKAEEKIKQTSKENIQNIKGEERVSQNFGPERTQDLSQLIQQFREGIRGISSSVQQFEKTIDSLTQLYQTIDQLGGFSKLPQWIQPQQRNGENQFQYDFNHMIKHVQSLIGLLEKIDIQQVQQFLNSPFIRNILSPETKQN